MGDAAFKEGVVAFARDVPRSENPYGAGQREWLNWRDGWEQAKALEAHLADGTAEACCGKLPTASG